MVVFKRSVGTEDIVGMSNRCRKPNCICGQAGGQGFEMMTGEGKAEKSEREKRRVSVS